MISTKSKLEFIHDEHNVVDCRVCSKKAQINYFVYQSYVSWLGLPLFPSSKRVEWTCLQCTAMRELRNTGSTTLNEKDKILKKHLLATVNSARKLKYYWGSLLLIALVVTIVVLVQRS